VPPSSSELTAWWNVDSEAARQGGVAYLVAHSISGVNGDRAAALAAGGLLAMLTDSLMPFAFEQAGDLAGAATALGFCVSLMF